MSIVNAHYGDFVITASTVAVTFTNSRWSSGGGSRLADITTSGTTGSQYLGIINDPSWEVDAPLDTTQYPSALGFTSGMALAKVYGKWGSSGAGERISMTTIESIDFTNDNTNDATRVVIRGRGGYLLSAATN